MKHTKIFIVEGNTGEYSDHQDWAVAAYLDEDLAKQHVELASVRARELYAEYDKNWEPTSYDDIPEGANQYDPRMRTDYTGVRYHYYDVEIRSKLP